MRDRTLLDWRVPEAEWERFVEHVENEFGSIEGYLGREAEAAMREYADTGSSRQQVGPPKPAAKKKKFSVQRRADDVVRTVGCGCGNEVAVDATRGQRPPIDSRVHGHHADFRPVTG